MDWLDLLLVQGTLKSFLQHHSPKASVLLCSAFFIVQLSHPYMITGKTVALTFVGKVMSQFFNMLSRLVMTFLPRRIFGFYLISDCGASLIAQLIKNPPAMQETWVRSLSWDDPLEKEKATHSSILAWSSLWTA